MVSFLRKSLSYIATGSFSIVFAACYGPPMKMENPKLLNVKNNKNEAIQGLKVTVTEDSKIISEQYTNESGQAQLFFFQKSDTDYSAVISDVDGTLNGEYKSQTIDLTKESLIDVTMENAN